MSNCVNREYLWHVFAPETCTECQTQTMKAISEIRDGFPQGTPEWWDCVRWLQECIEIEKAQRRQEEL